MTDEEKVNLHPQTASVRRFPKISDINLPPESAFSSSILNFDGSPVGPWNYLDDYFQLSNKIVLDKMALSERVSELQRENKELKDRVQVQLIVPNFRNTSRPPR